MIITTTQPIEGRRGTAYHGVVVGEAIMGANGSGKVLQKLPMAFAVEAQKLVAISLEGAVG